MDAHGNGADPLPSVCVVIPTHDRSALLSQALSSVVSQEPGPYTLSQIVVVADRCSDDTPAVARSFPDVTLLETSCGTAGLARNAGLERVKGDWVAFLDDDDVFLPNKLRVAFSGHHASADFLYSDAYIDPEAGATGARWGVPPADTLSLLRSVPAPSTWLVRRSVFDDVGAFDGRRPRVEDREFVLRALVSGRVRFAGIPAPLVSYRIRPLPVATIGQTWADTRAVLGDYRVRIAAREGWPGLLRAELRLAGWYAQEGLKASLASGATPLEAVRCAWSISPPHAVWQLARVYGLDRFRNR